MKKITKRWTQKDGKKIRICDMTDQHLLNTIRMLCRNAERIKWTLPYPDFQGEMAQFFAESEWFDVQNSDPLELASRAYDLFEDLMAEAERRDIAKQIYNEAYLW